MYPAETLTYSWFINYFLALAIITIPFVVLWVIYVVVEWIKRSRKETIKNENSN